jgi:AraC-like DNA-binding protein
MTRLRTIKNWPDLASTARYQVKTLAKICEVSPRQLERFFLRATGLRAHEWMHRLRQFEALLLLRKLGSVKATALHLGYKQSSHFSVKFRSYYGISPSEFLSDKNVAFLNEMSDFNICSDFSQSSERVEMKGRGKSHAKTPTAHSNE